MRKLTYDEVKQRFEERGYELISTEYIGIEEKLEYICPKHREKRVQKIDYSHLKRGQGCRFCGKENKKSGRQKDLEDYNAKELTESKGMEFIEIARENSILYVYYICPKHRHIGIQRTTLASMRKMKVGCPYCIGRNKTTESFKNELFLQNPNIEVLGEYVDAHTNILCKCLIDGHKWAPTPNTLLTGQGCPVCAKAAAHDRQVKSNEQFLQELAEINPTLKPLEPYYNDHTKILVHCETHNYTWLVAPNKILHRRTGCPKCSLYSNEAKIVDILEGFGYIVEPQKRFDDCCDKLPLLFDIYVEELNLLIEYDGEGHYIPIPRGGISKEKAEENLRIVQKHDAIKTQYCKDNNILLIRVPYWENKNLYNFLITQLKQHKINV